MELGIIGREDMFVLIGHNKDSDWNGKPLEGFKQENHLGCYVKNRLKSGSNKTERTVKVLLK